MSEPPARKRSDGDRRRHGSPAGPRPPFVTSHAGLSPPSAVAHAAGVRVGIVMTVTTAWGHPHLPAGTLAAL
jgi:hypothetical protein